MDDALVLVVGYLVGGAPTADWLAGRAGVDLRTAGSGNPGTNNALRLGGRRLALQVLAAEILKGVGCVALGGALAGGPGMVLGGLGAVSGNVLNPYRRLKGGQGLAITAGVLLAALPVASLAGVITIAIAVRVLRRSAPASLVALAVVGGAAAWLPAAPWGIEDRSQAIVLAAGILAIVGPKQMARLRSPSRPPTPAQE